MYNIRYYTAEDYPMLKTWWEGMDEVPPSKEMLPLDSTLILEMDEVPAVSVTLYFTNCREFCHLANIIGNPDLKGKGRKEATQALVDAAISFAGAAGFKRTLSFGHKDKVKTRFEQLGLKASMSNLQAFVRETN